MTRPSKTKLDGLRHAVLGHLEGSECGLGRGRLHPNELQQLDRVWGQKSTLWFGEGVGGGGGAGKPGLSPSPALAAELPSTALVLQSG